MKHLNITDPTQPVYAGPCPRCGGLSRTDNTTHVCSLPALSGNEQLVSEYLDRLVWARQDYLRVNDLPLDQDARIAVGSLCASWTHVVSLLASQLGIESRITGILESDWKVDAA